MSLRESAITAVEDCMDVRQNESVVVVTDERKISIGRAIHEVAGEYAEDSVLIETEAHEQHGKEPPSTVAAAMKEADVIFIPTTASCTHTNARLDACENGTRCASMPGITEEMMLGAVNADYIEVQEMAERYLEVLDGKETMRLVSEAGTDLTLDVGGREWIPDTGICHEPGENTNLPAGEVFISPVSGDGVLVIDGSMAGSGVVEEPIEIEFEDGRAVDISNPELAKLVDEAGDCGRNLAELGIGLNPEAELVGDVLQDEKVFGTIHVAIGDSSGFGGDVECSIHLDGIVKNPTVEVDGRPIEIGSS
ncbi:MAG: aminopeptidase [Halobacteria archaeon]